MTWSKKLLLKLMGVRRVAIKQPMNRVSQGVAVEGDAQMRPVGHHLLLQRAGRVTVVGLSTRPTRDSHRVATYLRDVAGYEVIGVNPGADHIDGFALGDLQGIEPLGIVDVFRASEHVSGVVDACSFFSTAATPTIR